MVAWWPAGDRLSGIETVLLGEGHQLGPIHGVELAVDRRPMGLDRPDADHQALGDLGVRITRGDQSQDF
jgi:hypothetical protein